MSLSVPIKLLQEGEGHVVTIELVNGETFRGYLTHSEENMNCELKEVTHRAKNGQISKKESVFIRGSHIRFFLLPELLKHSNEFTKVQKYAQNKQKENKKKKR